MSKNTKAKTRAAKALDDEHLYCRTIGHRWDRSAITINTPKTAWGTPLGFRCQGCEMIRIDVIDARGRVSYRMYKQPEGYRIPKDKTPNRATLRLEYLRR